jgi:amidohydrolase
MQEQRAQFHQYPELSFEEWETRQRVLKALPTEINEIHTSESHAGVWGFWKGLGPKGSTVGLRADMDALPIEEDAHDGRPYTSKHKGIMHACGHDVHMTCLLGALHILKDCRQDWGGTLSFLFQPGEEKLPGGANAMMESGALDALDTGPLLALHVFPEAPVGTLGFRPGPYMASTDELHIQVKGSGGHAALPERMTNPVVAAAELTTELYELPKNLLDKAFLPIVAIGKINAPGATNVIPPLVEMEGTIRCLKAEDREHMHDSIQKLAKKIAQKHESCA